MYEWKKPDIGRHHLFGIVIVAVLIVFGWLYYDAHRNEPIYNNTDNTMADIEKRIDSLEQRIATMQDRLAETQKTVNGISAGIKHSTELANEITDGIGSTETRLDDAIQRSGRIQNLITEIENANRQRTQNPQTPSMAK